MVNIIKEAIIFTMGYVLTNIEDNKESKSVSIDKEDIPEFKNITMENINCTNSEIALKVLGLPELPIHDIKLVNSKIVAKKGLDLSFHKNIILENVTISLPDEEITYKKEIF